MKIVIKTRKKAIEEDCHFFLDYNNLPTEGKWAALIYNVEPAGEGELPSWAAYHDGWNNSFHDAWYEASVVAAVGRSPSRARRRLRRLIREGLIKEKKIDVSIERFRRRNLVRFGD
jgi:hypothetical protein